MESCKFCFGEVLVRSGFVRGKQRYKCKDCGKNQVLGDAREKYTNAVRRQAIAMYLNSMGLRAIGRVLGIPYQLVARWVEHAGEIVEQEILKLQAEPRNIAILEMDELYTYIKKNSSKYEYGWLLIGTEARLLRLTSEAERLAMQGNFTG